MTYRIPKTLDNPLRVVGLPIDTVIVFAVIFSGGVLFDKGLHGIIVGIIAANIFARFRTRSVIRKIVRFMYWYLPCEMNPIQGIQGHQRKLSMRFKRGK